MSLQLVLSLSFLRRHYSLLALHRPFHTQPNLLLQPPISLDILLRLPSAHALPLIAPNPRALSTLHQGYTIIPSPETPRILLISPIRDRITDLREERVDDVEVVDLEERPREHFVGGEEVVDVGGVVGCAGVAGAGGGEGFEGGGVVWEPHVYAYGLVGGRIRIEITKGGGFVGLLLWW